MNKDVVQALQDTAISLTRALEAFTKVHVKKPVAPKTTSVKRAPKEKVEVKPVKVSTEGLLQYVRKNPGQRSEQIEKALGWPKEKVKTGLAVLRDQRQVRTRGQRRGTTYKVA